MVFSVEFGDVDVVEVRDACDLIMTWRVYVY